nr:hypothetical protein GCM10020092_038070 [Actinoplanes digitatis]
MLRDDALGGRNVLPALIAAVRARATLGELRVAMQPEPLSPIGGH